MQNEPVFQNDDASFVRGVVDELYLATSIEILVYFRQLNFCIRPCDVLPQAGAAEPEGAGVSCVSLCEGWLQYHHV